MILDQTLPPIALTGLLRSGKDTVADYLVRQYGYTRVAFGDALKDDFHLRYPEIPREPKPRVGYQSHGQLMRRLFGEDVWVRTLFDQIAEREAWEQWLRPYVITDLRQPNEYAAARARGFTIIRVTAPEDVRLERARQAGDAFNPEDLAHETESHVGEFAVDYEVANDGTVDELHSIIDSIMTEVDRCISKHTKR